MERNELKRWLAAGWSLERIGRHVGKHPETVSYWVRKHGLKPNGRAKHAARGGISREEMSRAVDEGLTIAELAELFNRSKGTVRHWMGRYGLKTKNRVGQRMRDELSEARAAGVETVMATCDRHGSSEYVRESRGRYRCRKCRSEALVRRRRKVKAILIAEAGGRCCLCGYDRNPSTLQFHHLDPAQKRFGFGARGQALALGTQREEARKCVLLCANCHSEVEAGIAVAPLPCRERP